MVRARAKLRCQGLGLLLAVLLAGCGDDGGGVTPDAAPDAPTPLDALADGGADAGPEGGVWEPRFDDFVAALRADLEASQAYGVSAAVLENGTVTFAQAFGSKDPDGTAPLTPTTLMQIGSTTKQFTATALLRQVEAGRTTLAATLETVLPALEFARDASWDDQITLHHLLSHQGGFNDFLPWDANPDDELLATYTYGAYAREQYLMSPPGAFWNYSNPNFVLAGLVSQELDGRLYPDLMREDIFQPLGMTRTFLRKTEVEADGDYAESFGYGTDDLVTQQTGPVDMAHLPDPGWVRPAGLMWTTPTQMMRWASFLMEGNPAVLSDGLRAEITREHVDTLYRVGTQRYGYGMFVERGYLTKDDTWYPMTVWEHGGNTLSFSHVFYLLPEQRFAVAICSSGLATDFANSLDAAMTTLVDLPEPAPGPEYVIDVAQFDRHVGTYRDPFDVGDMFITRQGDTLRIELPTVTQAGYDVRPELEPVSSEIFLFYFEGSPLDLTFIPLVPGGPSQYARNRAFVTTRVPTPTAGVALHPQPSPGRVARWWARARLQPAPLEVLRALKGRPRVRR